MAKVIIDMGQSNQSGRGDMSTMSAQYKVVLPSVKVWDGTTFSSMDYSINNNQFPVANRTNQGGSEFVRSVALANYFGEDVYRISYTEGGTVLAQNVSPASLSWNTFYNNGLYGLSMTTIRDALIYLQRTLGATGFMDIYIFWEQGETDSQNFSWMSAYQTNITNYINRFRGNLSGTATRKCVFIISRVNTLITYPASASTTITAATNATPIEITTSGAHGRVTGDAAKISGVLGNTAANGTYVLTVISTTKYTLDGSVGNGVYTSGGYANYQAYAPEIATAQTNAIAALTNAYSISTDAYPLSDGTHFTMAGYEAKGQAEANIIINNGL